MRRKDDWVHNQLVFATSQILQERREQMKISQEEMAKLTELHRSYIGDFERVARKIAVKNLSRIALALDMKASEVLGLAEKRLEAATKRKTT